MQMLVRQEIHMKQVQFINKKYIRTCKLQAKINASICIVPID